MMMLPPVWCMCLIHAAQSGVADAVVLPGTGRRGERRMKFGDAWRVNAEAAVPDRAARRPVMATTLRWVGRSGSRLSARPKRKPKLRALGLVAAHPPRAVRSHAAARCLDSCSRYEAQLAIARKQVYEERVRRMQQRKASRYDPSEEWDAGDAPEEPPARSVHEEPSRQRRGSHGDAERRMPRRTVSKEDVIRAKEMEREREIEKRKSQLAEAMREVRACVCLPRRSRARG